MSNGIKKNIYDIYMYVYICIYISHFTWDPKVGVLAVQLSSLQSDTINWIEASEACGSECPRSRWTATR